jgi:hypothetical protein
MLLLVIVACFGVLFFYAFVQYFSTWPKGCLRARGWLRLAPRLWAIFVSGATARICYRLLLKTQSCFLGLL